MKTSDFDYDLPEELIAQSPCDVRDECRMLVLHKDTGQIDDRVFKDVVDYLHPGDLLVANETRVRPCRLIGNKRNTGGACEIFLLRETGGPKPRTNKLSYWEALVRPGKRLKPGTGALVDFTDENGNTVLSAEVIDWAADAEASQKGERVVAISTELASLDDALNAVGKTPLPPYIKDYDGDDEMYQTVYSTKPGSAAAPTAGLHFTDDLIHEMREKGIGWSTVDLEVGLDTFRIVDEENAEDHVMHTETYSVPEPTVQAIKECKARGGRVVAVGTTTVRSLESAASEALKRGSRELLEATDQERTSIFIMPGYEFKVVDALITNFHVPKSTLLMLVSAFASRDEIMHAYNHAIQEKYRMLSFGDSMFIL